MKLVPAEPKPRRSYVCPMHPEVTALRAGDVPEVRDELVPSELLPVGSDESEHGHGAHEHADGLEWEDLMPEINRADHPAT